MESFRSSDFNIAPSVTVITVVRNLIQSGRKEAFRRCVDSVSTQDISNLEHLIIDGASTDGSLEWILECCQKARNLRVISEPDTGIYDAMNKGIRYAKAPFLAFLNSDDFYHDPRGLRLSQILLEETNADFSYSAVRIVDSSGTPILHPHCAPTVEWSFVEMPFSHQSMLFRRKLLREFGGYNTKYTSASDYDLILRHILSGKKAIEVPLSFATFSLGGLSQVQMTKAQHETGEVYCDLYAKACAIPLTPTEGYNLYLEKRLPACLQAKLLPSLVSCFYHTSTYSPQKYLEIPVISILFQASNSESLSSRIDSLRQQTFSSFEVIALGNPFDSASWEALKSWQKEDCRVKLLSLGSGLCTAMNCGINGARGKYLFFYLEDDDLSPTTLEQSLEISNASPTKGRDVLRCERKLRRLRQFHRTLIRKQALKPTVETVLFVFRTFLSFPFLFLLFVFYYLSYKDPKLAFESLFMEMFKKHISTRSLLNASFSE